MPGRQHIAFCLIFLTLPCRGADLDEIVGRGTATLKSDWAADADYAYVEKDVVQKGDKTTSRISQVVYIDGSDYYLPLGIDGQPENAELEKLKNEARHRDTESAEERRKCIEKYKKERDENEALILDFPNAFNFELLREETIDGHPAYVLSGTPKKRTGNLSLAAKVLSGIFKSTQVTRSTYTNYRLNTLVLADLLSK